MEIGKLSNEQLNEMVFSKIKYKDKKVLVGSGIGEDCSIIDFKGDLCVISSDPITATANNMGKLAVYVSCNDIASKGIRPFGIMVTVLAPPTLDIGDVRGVMAEIIDVCNELNIELIGGHTEVTDAVNRMVLSVTCLGSGTKKSLIDEVEDVVSGDILLMTKYAGCEGTTILYSDFKEKVEEQITGQDRQELETLFHSLSVIEEGVLASEIGVKTMHDATEGGILGGAWEVAEKAKLGIRIDIESIPILSVTNKIANLFDLDPLKLISSGVMLIVVSKEKSDYLINKLNQIGIKGSIIGEFTNDTCKVVFKNGKVEPLLPPETDEIYKPYLAYRDNR